MAKNNILIVAPDFYPTNGGYANAVGNLTKHLTTSNNYEITVLTLQPLQNNKELDWPNLNIVRVSKCSLFGKFGFLFDELALGKKLRKLLLKVDYHFVLFESFENSLGKWIAVKNLSSEIIRIIAVRVHATTETEVFLYNPRRHYKMYLKYARKLANKIPNILCTTPYYINFIKKEFLDNNVYSTFKNYGILPNFVEPFEVEGDNIVSTGKIKFFTLGRMNYQGYNQKNFELIAHAIYLLSKRNPEIYNKIEVEMVCSGEYRQHFDRILQNLNIHNKFNIHNSLPNEEVRRLQSSVHAVVLVSRYEGQSMFALESLAAGAPLIVSENSGITNLVKNNINGFHVNHDDPYSLADAMIKLSQSDIQLMKKASSKLFNDNFKSELNLDKLYNYIDLCRNSAK